MTKRKGQTTKYGNPGIGQSERRHSMIDHSEQGLVTATGVLENGHFPIGLPKQGHFEYKPSQVTDCTGHNRFMLRVPALY